jgi:predicted kinase
MQAIIFIGIQASGKSTFFQQRFFHSHLRLNLDMLKTRHREQILLQACLEAKQPFVIDNTYATRANCAKYISAAKATGFSVVGYYFHPKAGQSVTAERRRMKIDYELPMKDVYGEFVLTLLAQAVGA